MARTKQTEAAEKKVPVRKAGTTAAAVKAQVPAAVEKMDESPAVEVKTNAATTKVEEEQTLEDAVVGDTSATEEVGEEETAAAAEGEEEDDEEVEVDPVVENVTKKEYVLTDEDKTYIDEILKMKIKISDGTESQLFSYGPKEFANKLRPVICHLCRVGNLLVGDHVKRHIAGKTHTKKGAAPAPDAQKFLEPFMIYSHGPKDDDTDERKYFKIFPGENIETITAEHESRIGTKPRCELKPMDETLKTTLGVDNLIDYNKIRPILGIEYLIKYKLNRKIKYFCALCRETIYLGKIFNHVTGALHQATFIIKHFPNTYETVTKGLKDYSKPDEKEQIIRNIFRKHYRKLEMKEGRKEMHLVDARDLMTHRVSYVVQVRHRTPHFNETDNPIDEEELKKFINLAMKGRIIMPPDAPIPPQQQSQKGQKTELGKRKGDAQPVSTGNNQIISPAQQTKFDMKLKNAVNNLNNMYKSYHKNPKRHPQYNDEWSKFFHRRAIQLKRDNIDPDRYNFSKEWEQFWARRLRELYNVDLKVLKAKLKQQFLSPQQQQQTDSAVNPKKQKLANQTNQTRPPPPPIGINRDGPKSRQMLNNNNSPRQRPVNSSPRQRSINDGLRQRPINDGPRQRQQNLNNTNNNMGGQRSRQMNDGPRSRGMNDGPRSVMRNNDPRPVMRNDGPLRIRGMINDDFDRQQQRSYGGPVTIISVLRLLTALEDQLGSLGPKSVQLLSRAVLADKSNQNPNDLLTDNDYYILFATSKEKLKGQIIANVVAPNKRNAVNNAVNDLSIILDNIEEYMNRRGSNQRMGNGSGSNSNNNNSGFTGFGNSNNNSSSRDYGFNSNNTGNNDDNYNNRGSFGGGYGNNSSSIMGLNNSSNNYRNGGSNDNDNYKSSSIFGSSSNNQRSNNWLSGSGSGLGYNISSSNSRLNNNNNYGSGGGGMSQPQSLMSSSGGYDRNNSSNNFGFGGNNNRRY